MSKIKILEILSLPFTALALRYLKRLRKVSPTLLPRTTRLYKEIGLYPMPDHYYEPFPQVDYKGKGERLKGLLDLNVEAQLKLLKEFSYGEEIRGIWDTGGELDVKYSTSNKNFLSGSVDILYNFIRHYKPRKIIEIGSGNSTVIAANAVYRNGKENTDYTCEHICIEPFEMNWLKDLSVDLIREPVQNVDLGLFEGLEENDILFIDSSHIIRPGGDVLYEYLEILPRLKKGVLVHIHDIHTPYDYPDEWIKDTLLLWNEQYLLESILVHSNNFSVLNSLHFLHRNYFDELANACPLVNKFPDIVGSSMWLKKEEQ